MGEIAYSVGSALRYAGEIGYPVVIKPYDSNHGNGVTLNIQGREGVPEAFKLAVSFSSAAVVEKHITGQDYRVLVVGDKVSAVARRLPPRVTGDGQSAIRQLVDKENENPLRGEDHTKPLTKIELDDIAIAVLAESELTPDSILESGTSVYLRKNANLSTGGTAASCPDSIHPENAKLAVRAAKALGLDIAGVDICSPDLSLPLFDNGGAVLEVNAGPGLRMHLMPSEGPPATVAKDIMDMLYPPGMPYTVPICSVTGTNGKTTVTRLIAHTIALSGIKVGMTTTSGVYLGEECLLPGDNTGAVSASIVLSHPDTEAAVLETARGGIMRRGLGYDLADVGVITNISEDHLGQDGIETLEDLAHVKSLVVEAVKPWGSAVLNADDKMTPYFLKRVRCNVLMFSRNQDSVLLKEHLKQGGNAVWAHQGGLYTQYLGKTTILCRVEDIPITLKGTASCNVENALAAAAALLGLGIPESQIRQGLSSFRPDGEDNPGRFNIFEIGHVKVMLDYGHNIAGYSYVIDFLKKQNAKRLVGVIGVPGDRQDESVKKVGALCGQHFQKLIIKEDADLRGRKPGVYSLTSTLAFKGGFHYLHHPQRFFGFYKERLFSFQGGNIVVVVLYPVGAHYVQGQFLAGKAGAGSHGLGRPGGGVDDFFLPLGLHIFCANNFAFSIPVIHYQGAFVAAHMPPALADKAGSVHFHHSHRAVFKMEGYGKPLVDFGKGLMLHPGIDLDNRLCNHLQ